MRIRHPAKFTALLLGAALLACGQSREAATGAAPPAAHLTSNGASATMSVSSWGGGYCTNITIANAGTSAVSNWTLGVALDGTTLSNIWGGTSSVSGGVMTIQPVDYTRNIAPGASVSLGFCGAGSGTPTLSTFTASGGTTTTFTLTVSKGGQGSGTVASSPSGITCGATCSASFTSGAVVTLTATPDGGSTFTGWSGACAGTGLCVVTMSAAQSVSASFGVTTPNPTLSVVKAGTGSGTVTSSAGGISCGATCSASLPSGTSVTLTASAASGSTFTGWSSTCAGFASGALALSASCTVTATFDAISPGSPISINSGGAATGSFLADVDYSGGSTYSTTSAIDTTQLAGTAPPQAVLQTERYGAFTYTIPGLTAGSPYTVTLYFAESYWTAAGQRLFGVAINGTSVLSAFDIYAAAGGGNKAIARTFNTVASSSGQVVIAFTAGSIDNPKIDGLTVAAGSVDAFALTVGKPGPGSGTVTSTPSGISCGSACTATFAPGASVTLSAAASSGSTFAGWGGACSGTSTCVVTMSTAQSVTATFYLQVTTYPVTVTRSGSGTVTSSPSGITCGSTCSASFTSGSAVTLSAAAASGSTFAGWSGACTGTGACVLSMTAARAVTATFSGGSQGPCDLYQAAGTPCAAAHSTVRALYGAYAGNLYQVRRASDKTTRDIPVLTAGGYANASVQDSFCASTTCTISVIYDQSPNGNHLTKSPPGGWLNNGGLEANATAARITANGHTVYGVYTTMNWDNDVGAVGYRNNKTRGVATGDSPEAMYMVASGKHYNQWCCFDYGNAETNNLDNGPATMEAVYFGNSTQWGKGSGSGPWVMADLEDGLYAGGSFAAPSTNTSLVASYVTAMLKGYSGNRFALKGGDAQSSTLNTMYDGARPSGYSPQKKEGAIILGTGGDNSHTGEGTFFEGCITTGVPSDATDSAVQANIAAAGYGR